MPELWCLEYSPSSILSGTISIFEKMFAYIQDIECLTITCTGRGITSGRCRQYHHRAGDDFVMAEQREFQLNRICGIIESGRRYVA